VNRLLLAVSASLACAGAAVAAGPTIYRCGPEGREYSQLPCKDGQVVEASDPRSAAQRREAREVADSQARLARQLEVERRQREAAAAPEEPAGVKPAPVRSTAPAASAPVKGQKNHRKAAEEKDFVARVPAPPAAPKP
jgi:hypothetical protein